MRKETSKYEQRGQIQEPGASTTKQQMDDDILILCLRFLGNVVMYSEELAQIVLDAGYLDAIQFFLDCDLNLIRSQHEEVFMSLSNILAGNQQQIDAVLSRKQLLRSVVSAARSDLLSVRKQACWCICNSTARGTTTQKKRLVEEGAIEALCSILNPQNELASNFLFAVVEGLDNFLKVYGDYSCSVNPHRVLVEVNDGLDYLKERIRDPTLSDNSFLVLFIVQNWARTVDWKQMCG